MRVVPAKRRAPGDRLAALGDDQLGQRNPGALLSGGEEELDRAADRAHVLAPQPRAARGEGARGSLSSLAKLAADRQICGTLADHAVEPLDPDGIGIAE